ncbi:GMF family protein [Arthroderma uncinatum]|uniref:GMF family protein n=1 Tax=Arthroderma uncinatum TaxID=74035 RepID=UPI00144A6271|nr:GMF family protein [Arthroderma uncinatum]KAF3483107.1 GMF family protein [Arthroderma uncinatum]
MSDSRLYSFSPETKEKLRKFRLDMIDAKSQEIRPCDDEVYSKMEDLADELPDSSPRFILLSHPLTMSSGRLAVPYVLLYYLPENCNPSQRMMYAGAVELMRNNAEVNRVIEVESETDVIEIEKKLQGA